MLRNQVGKLSRLLADSKDRKGICIQLILTWLMSADGAVTDREMDFFDSAAPPGKDESYLNEFIFMCEGDKYLEVQLACEYLRINLPPRASRELLRLAVGLVLADSRLTYIERYILLFLADLLHVTRSELSEIFREVKGVDMPNIGDPSTKGWWEEQEKANRQRRTENRGSRSIGERTRALRARAHAILGLPSGASRDEIRVAFRRLANIHHPDRFQRLGPEAVRVANETFNRIKKAQDFLLNE